MTLPRLDPASPHGDGATGVVLVLHLLHRKRPDKTWVEALSYIAARATHIPIIRALCADGDLWLDGEETSEDVLRIRGCIEGHCVVYKSYPVPRCENERVRWRVAISELQKTDRLDSSKEKPYTATSETI